MILNWSFYLNFQLIADTQIAFEMYTNKYKIYLYETVCSTELYAIIRKIENERFR